MKLYKYILSGIYFFASLKNMKFWLQGGKNMEKKDTDIFCNFHKISILLCILAQQSTAYTLNSITLVFVARRILLKIRNNSILGGCCF
ncbi:hypothetical protein CGC48_09450 [Capnocytophaga cynodegmi]|uniref:Uncharacterized protein n=1 Tax=Capnocytophaga cynodegmi TaxID=28189 RepID=A0A250E791_9FLAO|nr:hypothetical protein CGC48_09450 [Capnocytophaga cynodegmi]